MVGIITGDIINSRKAENPEIWLNMLKKSLNAWGKAPKQWEIYRGDSFQLEVKDAADALKAALQIKAYMKTIREIDVRMAIGIGEHQHPSAQITEANGEAFILSGEKFEDLKRVKQTIAIKSRWTELDRDINLCLKLGLIAIDGWSVSSAELASILLKDNTISQQKIGVMLGINQSAVSQRYSRAYLPEIIELEKLYRDKISKQIAI